MSWAVQRGHEPWAGNVTVPQRRHSAPSSCGSSAVPVSRPSAIGVKARWSSIGRLRREGQGGAAGDHVAPHPPGLVELGDGEEGPDALAALVVARLAERELHAAV